jgi:hypothetical protein
VKRKPPVSTPVVAKEIAESAKASVTADRAKRPEKCVACASELSSPTSMEGLCWICRRLKISAWRDSDNQLSAPE